MQKKTIFVLALVAMFAAPAWAQAQKLVFVVRHAERADDGSMKTETDPSLSAAGQARALKLSAVLSASGITAIYVTPFKRTQQTAAPLAERLKLKAQPTPLMIEGLVARLKTEHANDIVLIVGHQNTIPGIVKALVGRSVTLGDTEYDNIFVLVPSTGVMTTIKY